MAKHYSSRSEDPLGLGIDLLERSSSALVKDGLSREALIFIVVVCVHAISELLDLILTELVQDGLTGGTLILSGEAIQRLVRLASILGKNYPPLQLSCSRQFLSQTVEMALIQGRNMAKTRS